ncbi:BMC domain-containing protein [Brevibacillus laterosporus]|uniref:BMC domain-containing protein n=1 Tax=Brevibacillus laterosporus TaxID=1465 RepID=A0AAP3DKT1_BRELA|nr:BMC domain-containing protein [Brevibacillus laterosporus]MCR8982686.1 BMC domain-containing protein [Brevibacillus laterosporus]MCZ0809842.1 BMC domain-containing protein [Brevibacillus laterosporus]MCZ0823951.1 BMC domain-containing protein [Brevibacillus laterosporus]MCZ0852429.1 BMC domain-containing protein [Brevibacillus laterosporus]
MSSSIGILELRSISKGYETADFMLKKSTVDIHHMRSICPGKFLIIVSGDTANVQESMETAKQASKDFLVSEFILNGVHNDIVNGLKKSYSTEPINAIGIFETSNVSSGIYAINLALKGAHTFLKRINLGMGIGGKLVAIITGSVSDVEQAMDIAVTSIDQKRIVHYTVMPSPSEEIKKQFR